MPTLLHNAFICTGVPATGAIEDGALLVEGSRITWIGKVADVPDLPPGTIRKALGRKVVIPGFINTHAHGGLSLCRGSCDDGDLFEWAAALAPHTSGLTLEDNRWGCYLAVLEMVRSGITTVCDCTRYGAAVFASVASAVGMRSLSGALANSPSLRTAGRPNWPLALQETRDAMAAHAGNGLCRFYLGAHSPYNCTPALLVEVKAAAVELGLPFTMHLAENRQEVDLVRDRYGFTPVRYLDHLGVLDGSSILAHCVWLDDEEIGILAARGARVAHNPVSNAKLASGVAPVPAFRRLRVPVGLGTDSTLSNNRLDLFQEMKLAVLLQRISRLDGYAMTATDVFAMATLEGARVLGWEDEIGSLEIGKEADLVVLDLDHPLGLNKERILSDIVYRAGPQNVSAVMVAGEIIFEGGRFTRVDEDEIHARVRQHAVSNFGKRRT